MKKEIEKIKASMQLLERGNSVIENIAKLADQKKATQQQGMFSLLLAISAFLVFRFCSKTGREILEANGMPETEIKLLLNFTKEFDGFETGTKG